MLLEVSRGLETTAARSGPPLFFAPEADAHYLRLPSKSGSLAMLAAIRRASSSRQPLRGFSITRINMPIDIGKALTVRVHNLEAAV